MLLVKCVSQYDLLHVQVNYQAFLVMRVSKNPARLKSKPVNGQKKKTACRVNSHLPQLGRLGSIARYAAIEMMTW